MPQYDYICQPCNKTFSFHRSMSEADPGYTCESCNGSLNRLYNSVGISFNAPGFYSSDNRKK